MSLKSETLETYTKSAEALSEKYDLSGIRTEDIEYVFSNCHKDNPFVFEIGYGNGRDAACICKHTNKYTGIDISPALSEIARKRVPGADFRIADVENYVFPYDIDIVFAFASLLHVPKESLKKILRDLHASLVDGGIIFISLKASETYIQNTVTDQYGTRTFWHYSKDDLKELGENFIIESMTESNIGNQNWLEVLYKKK